MTKVGKDELDERALPFKSEAMIGKGKKREERRKGDRGERRRRRRRRKGG